MRQNLIIDFGTLIFSALQAAGMHPGLLTAHLTVFTAPLSFTAPLNRRPLDYAGDLAVSVGRRVVREDLGHYLFAKAAKGGLWTLKLSVVAPAIVCRWTDVFITAFCSVNILLIY